MAVLQGPLADRDAWSAVGDCPIEKTIDSIGLNTVDMWVCSETIEHLDDPDSVLAEIRNRTKWLLLSTPDGETAASNNPEHIWSWDAEMVVAMLSDAGFKTLVQMSLDLRPAGYQYCYTIVLAQ